MKPYKIGIDLGGTKTEVVILGQDDTEQYRKRVPTQGQNDYKVLLDFLHTFIRDTMQHIPEGDDFSIGIGIPGAIDPETHLVQNANTTCLIGNPLQKDIESLLDRRVGIDNDANCFTFAESLKGNGKDYNLVFGIIMGTGCGGGICIDKHIRKGPNSIAGEWGHFSVDPNGSLCYCGNRGCVETKISGSGVEMAFYNTFKKKLSMQEIVKGYRANDPACTSAFNQFLDDFGRCLGGLLSVLDPDAVVLGGGLSNIDELYTIGTERARGYAFHRHTITPILKNRLGDSAGVLGAAWIGV